MKKTVTALLFCCACALAQNQSAVAIRNAKIVTVSGPVIAKGTVVVRNGLIEAVGENVAAVPDRTGNATDTRDQLRRIVVGVLEELGVEHPLARSTRRQLASLLY